MLNYMGLRITNSSFLSSLVVNIPQVSPVTASQVFPSQVLVASQLSHQLGATIRLDENWEVYDSAASEVGHFAPLQNCARSAKFLISARESSIFIRPRP